ncbi:helix-turn-helix domain-containing protein [Planctomycetota bacterium]
MKAKTNKNIEEQLRQAIKDSKLSRYRISKLTDVAASQLSVFMSGKRTLTLQTAAKIAEVLELELAPKKKNAPVKTRNSKRDRGKRNELHFHRHF